MALKTNKSYAKRIKITRNGKMKVRTPGQNHFNTRERSQRKLEKRRIQSIKLPNKAKSRLLVNIA